MSTDVHHVAFDVDLERLTFTCTGDEKAECHSYPDCDCEVWYREEPCHPFVQHSECWLQGWFDAGSVTFTGHDYGDPTPVVSHQGPITFEFDYDEVSWEWADGGPQEAELVPGERIGGGQPADSPTLFEDAEVSA